DAVVAGEQPDAAGAVPADEVAVFLVRQGLDRGGVEAFAPPGQGQVHGELAHHRLARPGRRGDEHPVPLVQRLARLALELVEAEVVQRLEPGELRPVLRLLLAERRVTLRRARHAIKGRREAGQAGLSGYPWWSRRCRRSRAARSRRRPGPRTPTAGGPGGGRWPTRTARRARSGSRTAPRAGACWTGPGSAPRPPRTRTRRRSSPGATSLCAHASAPRPG